MGLSQIQTSSEADLFCFKKCVRSRSDDFSTLYEPDDDHDQGYDEKNMDETSQCK